MPQYEIVTNSLHKGQKTILRHAKRVNIVACGRRWGKTNLAKYIMIVALLEGKRVGLFGPQFKDVEETWRAVVDALGPIITAKNESMYTMDTATGGHVKFWTLKDWSKKDEGRGVDYDVVIYDEFQKIPTRVLEHNWLNAVNPTLIKFGGIAWFFGTPPESRSHYAYILFCMGAVNNPKESCKLDVLIPKEILANPDPDFIAFRATTYTNPILPVAEVDRMRRRLPLFVFEREVLCKFVEVGANMFLTSLQIPEVAERVFSKQNLFKKGWPITISFDFNRSPMAAVLLQSTPDYSTIYAVKEFGAAAGEKVTVEYTCELIKQWLFQNLGVKIGVWGNIRYPCAIPLTITGDATGQHVHASQSESLNFFQLIQAALGLTENNFKVRRSNLQHGTSWLQMNLYLEKHLRIFVDPLECARLKDDMFSTRMTAEKKIDKKLYDPHFFDAFRYYFQVFLPVQYEAK